MGNATCFSNFNTFHAGFAFLRKEKKENYAWAIQSDRKNEKHL
jgi:hypothetical protein